MKILQFQAIRNIFPYRFYNTVAITFYWMFEKIPLEASLKNKKSIENSTILENFNIIIKAKFSV